MAPRRPRLGAAELVRQRVARAVALPHRGCRSAAGEVPVPSVSLERLLLIVGVPLLLITAFVLRLVVGLTDRAPPAALTRPG